jgi:hypothetical protein
VLAGKVCVKRGVFADLEANERIEINLVRNRFLKLLASGASKFGMRIILGQSIHLRTIPEIF